MALTLGKINPTQGFSGTSSSTSASTSYSTTSSTIFGGGGASVAGTLASQFVQRQASLIYSRFSSSDRTYIHQGIQERAQALERSARTLFSRNYGESVFDQREVVVSTSGSVTGTAERLTSPFAFGIEVTQIATAQKVVSDDLSDAGDDFSDGTEAFSLDVEGTTFSMSIDVGASDTNIDVLNAIATEVNAQNSSGVYAEVISDESTGESYLSVVAHATGTDSAFTLSGDILAGVNLEESTAVDADAGTGGLLASAASATYIIDAGSEVTSQSNTLSLYNDSVELVLSDTTDGEAVTITVQPNTSEIEAELDTFVVAYNDALSFALALPSGATDGFALELTAAVSPFVTTLASIGIDRSTTGELSIDSDTLTEALTDGRFARASSSFIGPAGLANTTERISRNLLDAGSEFLTHPINPVQQSALLDINRLQSIGMLVDLIA